MNWQQLVATNRAKSHKTSKQELDGLRAVVERDLKDAAMPGLSDQFKKLIEEWISANHPQFA